MKCKFCGAELLVGKDKCDFCGKYQHDAEVDIFVENINMMLK